MNSKEPLTFRRLKTGAEADRASAIMLCALDLEDTPGRDRTVHESAEEGALYGLFCGDTLAVTLSLFIDDEDPSAAYIYDFCKSARFQNEERDRITLGRVALACACDLIRENLPHVERVVLKTHKPKLIPYYNDAGFTHVKRTAVNSFTLQRRLR